MPYAAVGFVLGAFGKLSSSCYSLFTAIARIGAGRVVNFWKISPKNKQNALRFWGLTAQRGWARLIQGRFHDLLLSPGDPTATTREPDSASHEQHTFLFPDTGRGAAACDK